MRSGRRRGECRPVMVAMSSACWLVNNAAGVKEKLLHKDNEKESKRMLLRSLKCHEAARLSRLRRLAP